MPRLYFYTDEEALAHLTTAAKGGGRSKTTVFRKEFINLMMDHADVVGEDTAIRESDHDNLWRTAHKTGIEVEVSKTLLTRLIEEFVERTDRRIIR